MKANTVHTFARLVHVVGLLMSTVSLAGDSGNWTVMWFKETFPLAVMFSLVTILAAIAPSSPSTPVTVICFTRRIE